MTKENCVFTPDVPNDRPTIVIENKEITDFAAKIHASDASPEALARGKAFADEITARYVGDFERAGVDQMVHVTTFMLIDGMIYMTYYANTTTAANQSAVPGETVPTGTVVEVQFANVVEDGWVDTGE